LIEFEFIFDAAKNNKNGEFDLFENK